MYRFIYSAVAGLLVGVALRTLAPVPVEVLFVGFVAAVLCCGVHILSLRVRLLTVLVVSAFVLGVVRTEFVLGGLVPAPELTASENEQLTFTGVVVRDVDVRERHVLVTVDLESFASMPLAGRVLVYAPLYPRVSYGNRILVTGELAQPEAFETDTGRVFHYDQYLAKDGVTHVVYRPRVEVLAEGAGNPAVSFLFVQKERFLDALGSVVPEPQNALLAGLLVGAKRSLGEEWLERFRETGLIHIVVLSGYNVTIVIESIMRTLAFLPKYIGGGVGAVAIVAFALVTGASATIIRASLMALLVLLARLTNRPYAIFRALVLAAALMVLHSPLILLYDPSFQLSFLATLGLILLAPRVEHWFSWLPQVLGVRSIVAATLSTQLFVLPLLMYQIGEVSLIAPFANILVLPAVPLIMLLGFLAGLSALLVGLLALPLAWAAHLGLSYVLTVVELFAALPFASVTVPPIPWWLLIPLYGWLIWYAARSAQATTTVPQSVSRQHSS